MKIPAYLLAPLFAIPLLIGCNQGPALAPVHGRLTCNGKPVKEAGLIFSPVPAVEGAKESGKPATGSTDADGRFVLTTFKSGDGALIGKHRASVVLDNTVRLPCGNSKVVVVEVKPGDNELDIEMNQ